MESSLPKASSSGEGSAHSMVRRRYVAALLVGSGCGTPSFRSSRTVHFTSAPAAAPGTSGPKSVLKAASPLSATKGPASDQAPRVGA